MKEQEKIPEGISLPFKEILEFKLFSIGEYSLSVYEVLAAIIIWFLGVFVSKIIKKMIYQSDKIDVGKKFAFSQIFNYLIAILTFFLVMKTLGVNVSPLLVGSGAVLVGVGLGLQNLFLDFVSGVIILIDRSIKVGDVVDIEGVIGEVEEIKMRITTIKTRDNKSMIFPNSLLTKDKLINFSHHDNLVRFSVSVGVHYDSNVELVERLMIESALENKEVFTETKPFVWLEDFGESSLDFTLYYFSQNLFSAPRIKNELRKLILKKFRENSINMPYQTLTLDFPPNKIIEKEA